VSFVLKLVKQFLDQLITRSFLVAVNIKVLMVCFLFCFDATAVLLPFALKKYNLGMRNLLSCISSLSSNIQSYRIDRA
jgi:hypothetical protein